MVNPPSEQNDSKVHVLIHIPWHLGIERFHMTSRWPYFCSKTCIVFYAAVPFLLISPRLISKFVWKLAEEIGLQIGIKALSFLGSPANGKESNAKYSRFYTNRNLTETIYHWSVILRRINVVSNLTVHNVKFLWPDTTRIFWIRKILQDNLVHAQ